MRKWFGRKNKAHAVTVKMQDKYYTLLRGDTLSVQPTITIDGDAIGKLSGISIPIEVVSID